MAASGSTSSATRRMLAQSCCCLSSSPAASSSSKLFPSLNYASQRRSESSKASPPSIDRNIASTSQHTAFSDAVASDTVDSPQDANSAGSTGSPASPAAGASAPKSSKAPRPTAWLNGEGARYKRPLAGRTNWLGRTVRCAQ